MGRVWDVGDGAWGMGHTLVSIRNSLPCSLEICCMWKWIVGALLGLVVVVAALGYYAYHRFTKFASGGDSTSVMIGASPNRVFASLANTDSLAVWMGAESMISSSRVGPLAVGDTVHVESMRVRSGRSSWVVSELIPSHLLVRQLLADTTAQIVATRRDSLVPTGDSTRIVSTISSPLMDSIRTQSGDTAGKMGNAMLNLGGKVLISFFRAASAEELKKLKAHIEGKPAPAARP
jgi:uncharacterized protein YndB with AHSA1/START domain